MPTIQEFTFPITRNPKLLIIGVSFITYFIFKRFEPCRPTPVAFLLGFPPLILSSVLNAHFTNIITAYFVAFFSHAALISLFTVFYRLSPLHPLARYPGPFPNKISKVWMVYIALSGKQHTYYKHLHDVYGDFVRIGPNEISLRNTDVIQPVLGSSGLPKGPMWDGRLGQDIVRSLISQRNLEEHARRRRTWNRGFNTASLKNYEQIVIRQTKELIEAFDERKDKVLDISLWMSYFTFDFMGEMAFGASFGLVRKGSDPDGLWDILENGVEFIALMSHISWANYYTGAIPGLSDASKKLGKFGRERVEQRIDAGSTTRDLFYHLMDEEGISPVKPSRPTVISDGVLAIVAGSDTTALTLSALWYYLLRNPASYKRLQSEVDRFYPDGEEPQDLSRQSAMPFLNACLNEALRLLPPVISGSQRSIVKGTGDRLIGSQVIPEGTQVFVHTYSIQRDPRYFSLLPDTFWPDRWLPVEDREAPEGKTGLRVDSIIHDTTAFIPFSFGLANCAGKNLALLEMRALVCYVLQRYSIRIVDEDILDTWEETIEDYFTTKKGPLPVTLTSRR